MSIVDVLSVQKTLSGEKQKGFKPRMQSNMGFQAGIFASDTNIVFALLRMIERGSSALKKLQRKKMKLIKILMLANCPRPF